MTPKTRQTLSNKVATLANQSLPLDDFIHAASRLHPVLADVLEGIYCGTEGRIVGAIDDDYSIVVGWCYGKVEYAYIG